MLLEDLLDTVRDLRVAGTISVPAWTADLHVEGRQYSPAHIVCVGTFGHHQCLAQKRPARSWTITELDAVGHGGRQAICTGRNNVTVELTDHQSAELAVTTALSTAGVLHRYHSTGEADGRDAEDMADLAAGVDRMLDVAAVAADDHADLHDVVRDARSRLRCTQRVI